MGNGMNKIIPGLYVGNFRDSKDEVQLKENKITHILSIHDNAKEIVKGMKYLCIIASDSAAQDLSQYFGECIEFIHEARLNDGRVLVHCLAGVSRSVTITAVYIMTVTSVGWRDSLNAIRGARSCANPNFGFQRQLQKYDSDDVEKERKKLKEKYPHNPFNDEEDCKQCMRAYRKFILKDDGAVDTLIPEFPSYKGRMSSNTNTNCVTEAADEELSLPQKNLTLSNDSIHACDTGTNSANTSIRTDANDIEKQVDELFGESDDIQAAKKKLL